jgi:hypothetical protein
MQDVTPEMSLKPFKSTRHQQQQLPTRRPLPRSDEGTRTCPSELLMRAVLSRLGITIAIEKRDPSVKTPTTLLSRCRNAFCLPGYTPSTTVGLKLRFPQGMPVLMGHEAEIGEGCTVYRMPKAWHRECRLFVEQNADTVLSCNEIAPVEYGTHRKVQLTGLQDATARFFPETGYEDRTRVMLNSGCPHRVGEPLDCEPKAGPAGPYFEARRVSGRLVFAW